MKSHPFPAPIVHKPFCFAGQPAPCPGYFENDVLPCVCGATQNVLDALKQVQLPLTSAVETGRPRRILRLEPRHPHHRKPGTHEPAMWKQAG